MLEQFLKTHRDDIRREWLDSLLNSYPEQTAGIMRKQADRFRNPVGQNLAESINVLYDGLACGAADTVLVPALDRIIRIRAVQSFRPSEALGFVLELKRIVRGHGTGDVPDDQLEKFEARIDRLVLLAFDVYMSCREQISEIRANEIRNRTHLLLERTGLFGKTTRE